MLVVFAILVSYVNPVMNFFDAWQDSRAERTQLQELQREHAELRSRAGSLEGPDAAEHAARKLGMVASGERSYVIKD